jgi:hypothetical protein
MSIIATLINKVYMLNVSYFPLQNFLSRHSYLDGKKQKLLVTGVDKMQSRSMKILKHSLMPFLQVIAGSKIISEFSITWAAVFLAFLLGVSDRLLLTSITRGLYLGMRSFRHVSASTAQAWGFLQPSSLSQAHSAHTHIWDGSWKVFLIRVVSFLLSFIRSATDFVLWLFSMHFALTFVNGWGGCSWVVPSREFCLHTW